MSEKKQTRTAHWNKYNKENYKFFRLKIKNTDTQVLNKLNSVPSKNGYVLELIRKDIENENNK